MATLVSPTQECDTFFQDVTPPESFDAKKSQIDEFTKRHTKKCSRLVLITSGGTTVPLESRTVRYIDNFSIGTRGATSAEYFLKQGYAVLFLHRHRSLKPFYQRVDTNILDVLSVSENPGSETVITVDSSYVKELGPIVKQYHKFKNEGMLCMVDFTTLTDYLLLLRSAAESMHVNGNQGMIYLAAAVSDFYIPKAQMPEHKIQSSDGALQLSLEMTPKMLKPLVKHWAPNVYIVSFKLETDQSILIEKAKKALSTYQHQIVVANLLETRKQEVYIITKETEEKLRLEDSEIAAGREIEAPLVEKLTGYHSRWMVT